MTESEEIKQIETCLEVLRETSRNIGKGFMSYKINRQIHLYEKRKNQLEKTNGKNRPMGLCNV